MNGICNVFEFGALSPVCLFLLLRLVLNFSVELLSPCFCPVFGCFYVLRELYSESFVFLRVTS
jgi:hypothetical protein